MHPFSFFSFSDVAEQLALYQENLSEKTKQLKAVVAELHAHRHQVIFIYIYMYIYICMCIYVHMYIESQTYMNIDDYMCTYGLHTNDNQTCTFIFVCDP